MPLSDRERKLLAELEMELAADDPRLARALSPDSDGSRFRPSTYFAVMACLIGLALLIAGVGSQLIIVGVGGFLLMGAGAYVLVGGKADRFVQSQAGLEWIPREKP